MGKYKPWQTSEFWMTLVGAAGASLGAFGLHEAQTFTVQFGPTLVALIGQRVLSKTIKPGQIPFTNLPPK